MKSYRIMFEYYTVCLDELPFNLDEFERHEDLVVTFETDKFNKAIKAFTKVINKFKDKAHKTLYPTITLEALNHHGWETVIMLKMREIEEYE